jgi:hypothetical protein
MENPPGTSWQTGANQLYVETAAGVATKISCITFDLTSVPAGTIKQADLILIKSNSSPEGSMQVSALTDSWLDKTTWADIDTAGLFTDDSITVTGGSRDVIKVDVTTAMRKWIDGTYSNNGLRLRTTDTTMTFPFFSSEEGNYGPKLRVWHIDE